MGHTDVEADQNASNLILFFLRKKKSLEDIPTVFCQFSNCGSTSKC